MLNKMGNACGLRRFIAGTAPDPNAHGGASRPIDGFQDYAKAVWQSNFFHINLPYLSGSPNIKADPARRRVAEQILKSSVMHRFAVGFWPSKFERQLFHGICRSGQIPLRYELGTGCLLLRGKARNKTRLTAST